jgi:DUF438 domain-containing protein
MGLIRDLKLEHQKILQLFDEVEKSKFTKEKIIIELKNLAISHLQKEDQQLYPSLLNSEKEEIRGIASIFSNIMKKYSKDVISSINNLLDCNGKVNQDSVDNFKKISDKIKDRIVIEETILFPLYGQH